MFKVNFNKRILGGFLLSLGIITWLAINSFVNTGKLISTNQWVAHRHEVLYRSQNILAVAVDIEIGQRGFSLTGNEKSLEPYYKASKEIKSLLKDLSMLSADNPSQGQRISEMEIYVNKLLNFSASVIEARRKSFEDARQLNASLEGKQILDKIRQTIIEFEKDENELLQNRLLEIEARIQKLNNSFIIWLLATAVVLIIVFYAINVSISARIKSEQKLRQVSDEIHDLYDKAPCGYHSLNAEGIFVEINTTLLNWLGYSSKDEVIGKVKFSDIITPEGVLTFQQNFPLFMQKGFVHDLEFNVLRKNGSELPVVLSSTAVFDKKGKFVRSRSNTFDNTARKESDLKIKNLNHELEAFSYSVSHDLRAPLRSIDGYARVLQEDYYDKLDEEAKRVIKVILSNAKRMGQLIDDLLDFSKLGRKDISMSLVNMTPLVKGIADELVENEKDRKIEIVVNHLANCSVDIDMIRQVWINLISNAIKYTGKTSNARIEISSIQKEGATVFQISDNGVGFDMMYVDKLFGVFQRLHKIQDFSGTGVGLAIVKRIIVRHSGQVWAEGKLNGGAIFYFTIPS